jgi:hypothetical protein
VNLTELIHALNQLQNVAGDDVQFLTEDGDVYEIEVVEHDENSGILYLKGEYLESDEGEDSHGDHDE